MAEREEEKRMLLAPWNVTVGPVEMLAEVTDDCDYIE